MEKKKITFKTVSVPIEMYERLEQLSIERSVETKKLVAVSALAQIAINEYLSK